MILFHPKARCRKCGRRPNVRITDSERERAKDMNPEEVLSTVTCTRCGEMYVLTAKDYAEAA